MGTYELVTADVVQWAANYSGPKFHALFSDFPYGLEFMGQSWDAPHKSAWPNSGNIGGFANGNKPSFARQKNHLHKLRGVYEGWGQALLPHLLPGAVALVFGGTRTWHHLASGLEEAGFEMWDTLMWIYGTGFPKGQDVSKLIDKHQGNEREILGPNPNARPSDGSYDTVYSTKGHDPFVSAAGSPESIAWTGYKTASLKPAWEPILCLKRPLDDTYAATALEHGSGCLNIDGTRINPGEPVSGGGNNFDAWRSGEERDDRPAQHNVSTDGHSSGRYPANLAFECTCENPTLVDDKWDGGVYMTDGGHGQTTGTFNQTNDGTRTKGHGKAIRHTNPECPAFLLDSQTGKVGGGFGTENRAEGQGRYGEFSGATKGKVVGFGDTGGASRFFYHAKSSTSERSRGMAEGTKNSHPTVKPVSLAYYIAKLLLPAETAKPRRIMVPFSGSGSEVIGCLLAGWDEVVAVEWDATFNAVAKQRIEHALKGGYDKFV